ncbi:hypothetical protein OPKNFCMD_5465 [Methylobacterium crusticola]|uniref:Uncharacterized protein n=1 Tax=Methylobacterium crusticola TaxID=1697972 RepID=A0ABQ4R7A8_9HYPH|nr:hypothetical protein [Methylobacterium crusticola]GJD52699.1 hypothetical protein OPKNFCMD_5465 [Methylobacterium crusticola]
MTPADEFGPWRPGLDSAERLARLRSLRAIARLLTGPRGARLVEALEQAEHDPDALPIAADELNRMPSLDRRQILGAFAGLYPRQKRG